jgi:hypothetical protein
MDSVHSAPKETIDGTNKKDGPEEELQLLRQGNCSQENWGQVGGSRGIHQKEVLQHALHGCLDGGANQGSQSKEQPQAVGQDGQVVMPIVQSNETIGGTSHRRKPAEQFRPKLKDIVRKLPHAYTLARMEGDNETAEKLLSMFPSSASRRPVQHALHEIPEVWESPDREAVERAWEAGDFDNFRIVACKAIVKSHPGRTTMLKGFGNAIVPHLAAAFVAACGTKGVE